jgi:hypothetical protein
MTSALAIPNGRNQRATIIDALNLLVHLQGWMHGLLAARMTGFAASRDWSLLAAMLPLGILTALTRTLADGRDTLALGALLRGPLIGLTEAELLDIAEALPLDQDRPEEFRSVIRPGSPSLI